MTATHDAMCDLHGEIVKVLLEKIRSGEATGTDLNVARQLLKDNGITAGAKNKHINDLTSELDRIPDFEDEAVLRQ